LAVTLAELCFSSLGRNAIGADVTLASDLPAATLLFSETPSRIVISFDPSEEKSVQEIAERNNAPFTIIGRVGGSGLRIKSNQETIVEASVAKLESTWREGLTNKLHADALVAS